MNQRVSMAVRTPMSRTRPARAPNSSASAFGLPNSFTSVAPAAENRSVIWVVIPALSSAAWCCRSAIRRPIRRAGSTKIGRSTRATSVTCHDNVTITASESTSWMTLVTSPDSVAVNVRCAPMTSLFSLLTSAPVRLRMKNATGIRCTCSNTALRRSRINPSPMWADCQRSASPSAASATAMPAMTTASQITVDADFPPTIASTTRPARSGVVTARTADTTVSARKTSNLRQCGRANEATRRTVPLRRPRGASADCIAPRSNPHVLSTPTTPLTRPTQQRWGRASSRPPRADSARHHRQSGRDGSLDRHGDPG